MVTAHGTMYGVGVGPGDPDLLTVKAAQLIGRSSVIAYLAANGGHSTALSIAKQYIPMTARHIVIDMPMRIEREPGEHAYDHGARSIAIELEKGLDVVVLCEGDPFFYGSFIYLFKRLSDRYECQIVPGITALTASAAALRQPLSARDTIVKVVPATLTDERLKNELTKAETVAIIKVGRHFGRVRNILTSLNLQSNSYVVIRATQADQSIHRLEELSADAIPYFSTVMVLAKTL